MASITRQEVRANRLKWIEFLKDPKRRKKTGILDDNHGARCCLGHACKVLGIERSVAEKGTVSYGKVPTVSLAPRELIHMVGLWTDVGGSHGDGVFLMEWETAPIYDLANMNDDTAMSPQDIGEYLETVVEGGPSTPFRPLFNYPEEVK